MEYLYVLRSYLKDSSLLKFGFSTDIWARLAQYKSANPGIEIVYIAQLENALELEQAFHKKNPSVCGNEWYNEDMLSVIMDYLNSITHIDYTNETRPNKLAADILSFQKVVIECQKQDTDYLIWAYNKYDFLKDALQYLGFEKIEAMNFHMGNVKKLTSKFNHKSHNEKIKSCLSTYKEIGIGLFVSSKRLKDIFSEIYEHLEIVKTSKATDIEEYYNLKNTVKSIKGVLERGYIVMNEKH